MPSEKIFQSRGGFRQIPVQGKWIKFKLNGAYFYAKTNKYGVAQKVLGKKVINKLNKGIYKVKVFFENDMIKTKVKVK